MLCGVKSARFDAGIGKQLGEFPGFFSPFRSGDEGGKLDIAPFQMVDMTRFFPHGADEAQAHIDTVRRDDAGNFLRIPHAVLKCNNSRIRSHQRGKGSGKSGVCRAFPCNDNEVYRADFLRVPVNVDAGQGDIPMQAFHLKAVFFQIAVFRTYDEGYVLPRFLKSGSVIATQGSGSQNGDFHGVRRSW